jgi:hypothetical protein
MLTVDNIPITDETDFAEVALYALRGGGGSLRSDNAPVDWVFRAYTELAGTPYVDRLTLGVAACLDSDVRDQALLFFISYPEAAGAERVTELAASGPAEGLLLEALGARIAVGDEDAVLLGQLAAVRPGHAGPVIAELTDAVPEWVVARAEQITRLTPTAGATILIRIQGTGYDLLDLARRIVPLCHGDSRFELDISRFIDDPATRQAILELF